MTGRENEPCCQIALGQRPPGCYKTDCLHFISELLETGAEIRDLLRGTVRGSRLWKLFGKGQALLGE